MASQDSQEYTANPAFQTIVAELQGEYTMSESDLQDLPTLVDDITEEMDFEAQAQPVTIEELDPPKPDRAVDPVEVPIPTTPPPHFNLAEEFKSMKEHFIEMNKNMSILVKNSQKSFNPHPTCLDKSCTPSVIIIVFTCWQEQKSPFVKIN